MDPRPGVSVEELATTLDGIANPFSSGGASKPSKATPRYEYGSFESINSDNNCRFLGGTAGLSLLPIETCELRALCKLCWLLVLDICVVWIASSPCRIGLVAAGLCATTALDP
jgi:hypothetical protein